MRFIVWDFEVFPHDTLLGTIIVKEDGTKELYQTWDPQDIKDFYFENKDDAVWIGHNSDSYDSCILEAIIKGRDPYQTSKKIVRDNIRMRAYVDIASFDCMKVRRTPFSLKLTELISGRSIETTEVDFDIPRELTFEEKELTEKYNKADLEQTLYNFEKFSNQFNLRIDIINAFGLDLKKNIKATGTQLAASVLGAKKDDSLKYKPIKPTLWPNLRLKNKAVIDFYLNEEYMKKNLSVVVGGCEHILGKGGIHAALPKFHAQKLLYYDVSGYYNLVMINLDLLPRTLDEAAKKRYIDMYHEQLKMKGVPEKANARKAYKTILLSVFGAMNNEYSDFYDPAKFYLVTLSGQIFIIDLLEKLEPYARVVQSNTDGIVIEPFDWSNEGKIDEIVKEWEDRTGFNMEKGYLRELWQRDVNCYFALDDKGEVDYKGDVINYKTDDQAYGACKLFDANNPPVIAKALIDYMLFGVPIEETVQKCKSDLRNFQFACKKGTFDSMTYDTIRLSRKPGRKTQTEELVSSVPCKALNRAFAKRIEFDENGDALIHTLVKHKDPRKKGPSQQKVSNLPESVFVWNESIVPPPQELLDEIDYQFYIDKTYEKVLEFIS